MKIFFLCVLVTVAHADVSHLGHNLQADGYHYEQPSFPFPSENEIIPQQTLSARNDFNPPAFLFVKPDEPEVPVPHPLPEQPAVQAPEYIPPAPLPVATNLQEDGYHYQQPLIPFPSSNEIVPQQSLSGRNDFNPPPFLLAKPDAPATQEPVYEEPAVQTQEYISPEPVESNLQEDGYHYVQPSIPFETQQLISGRNDYNPPAFLLVKPEEPEEPASDDPESIELIPAEPEQPASEEPEPVEPETQYLPVIESEPLEPQPEISSNFGGAVEPEPEPSYSLGPNGYNYRVPSRPFIF